MMTTFQDHITCLTGVGDRTASMFERFDVETIGDLISEESWRSLKSSISTQYYEDARTEILGATVEQGTPDNFNTDAHARVAQWSFLTYGSKTGSGAYRSHHIVLGNWHQAEDLPSRNALRSETETILPTHRTASCSEATYTDTPDNGIVPSYLLASATLSEVRTVSDWLLDGQGEADDTLVPATSVGLLASLFNTTPTELLDDSSFLPHGPVAFSDPDSGLDVLVGPLVRPSIKQCDHSVGVDDRMVVETGYSL